MPQVGEVIDGKYRLERLLSQGKSWSLFEAVHVGIVSKKVVLKLLEPPPGTEGEAIARFHREAQLASSVGHQGVVAVHDVGVREGLPYLVMEHLQGRTLSDELDEGEPLDEGRAVYITCQVLSVLSAVHEAGVVHRDIKPANIFLIATGTRYPAVKLLGFGVSRVVRDLSVDAATRFTKPGQVVGTPGYMSPEQARGLSDVDHRSDIFVTGAILYEMLFARPPFTGDNYNTMLLDVLTGTPTPPRELRPDLSEELEAILEQALVKDRDLRFQHAHEMLQRLLPLTDPVARSMVSIPAAAAEGGGAEGGQAPPRAFGAPEGVVKIRKPWHRWIWLAAAAALLLLGLLGAGAYLLYSMLQPS